MNLDQAIEHCLPCFDGLSMPVCAADLREAIEHAAGDAYAACRWLETQRGGECHDGGYRAIAAIIMAWLDLSEWSLLAEDARNIDAESAEDVLGMLAALKEDDVP